MLEKQAVVDQIEITRNGTVQVRMGLLIVEGQEEIAKQWHRTAVEPGGDVEAQFELVNVHLEQMGYPALSEDDILRVKAQAETAWTPEVVSSYRTLLENLNA
jgi:hypothetical protein